MNNEINQLDKSARSSAIKQWTQNPCGAVESESPESLEYFQKVERERYRIQDWMHEYFNFAAFGDCKVLEIGVGQGTDMLQFARNGSKCYGADITEQHALMAQQHLALYGFDYHIEICDATHLSYADANFDCVYSFGVLHHIPEIDNVIQEIDRVLKPGGQLQIALYYRYSAFHFVSKLLVEGLLKGKLLGLGYRGLMSTIETGADGREIKPYVTTYSRARLRKLFKSRFDIVDISVFQLKADHFYFSRLGKLLMSCVPWLNRNAGWYVTLKATKKIDPENRQPGPGLTPS